MKEVFVMGQGEAVLGTQEYLTLDFAEGSVDPAVRVAEREIQQDRVDELTNRLQQREFITRADPEAIPCDCMDCRGQANGQMVIGVKAAGGTETLVIADALTYNSYRHPGEKAPAHKERTWNELIKAGKQVGGHVADNVTIPGYAGCGAEDKLDSHEPDQPSILGFIERESQPIFETLRSFGYEISLELEQSITAQDTALRREDYATNGVELSQAGLKAAGEQSLKTLSGPQNGVVVAILTQPGEILDQQRIADEFGPDYQVFEVAAWAIENGATATSIDKKEKHPRTIAGLVYNLAAAGVIAGPGMRVVVL